VSDSQHGCALLSIIEANPFKHLTHLSLRFVAGNDAAVKKYLADCLKEANDQNAILRDRFQTMESDLSIQLSRSDETLKQRVSELESLRADWTLHTNSLVSKHAQELATAKEKSLQALTESQQKIEEEKRDIERCHQAKSRDYETKIGELQASNKELTEHKYKSESTIHELRTKLSSLEDENQRLRQDVQTLRADNSSLDATCHDRDKTVHQLKTRLAVLEQEVKDKEEVVTKNSLLLQTTSEQRVKAEGLLEQKERDLAKLESTVKSLSSEVMKGNEIIQRLQTELKSYKDKVKLKSVVTTKQEMLIREKDNVVERQTHELSALRLSIKQRDDEIVKLQESLTASEARLEEREQQLKTNENVISYLNHQINDKLLEKPSFPGSIALHHDIGARHLSTTTALAPTSVDLHLRKPLGTHPLTNNALAGHLTVGQHKVTFKPHLRKTGIPVPITSSSSRNPVLPAVLESSPASTSTQEHSDQPTTAFPCSTIPIIDPKYLTSTSPVTVTTGQPLSSYQPTPLSSKNVSPQQVTERMTALSQQEVTAAAQNVLATEQISIPRSGPPPVTLQLPLMSSYFPH
jgi:spindle assembly abnormal protein 6